MDNLQTQEWIVFPRIYRSDSAGGQASAGEDYEIHYMQSGECDFFIEDRIYAMRAGDVVLLDQEALRHIDETGDQTRIVMEIHPCVMEWLKQMLPHIGIPALFGGQFPLLRLTPALRDRVEPVLTQMMEESTERQEGWESIYRTLLAQFFALIRRALDQALPAEGVSHSRIHDRLSRICRCIREQYARPLPLEAVADAYDVSPCYLSRMFKKMTGMSFSRYRNAVRVSCARAFLIQSRMPISAVAEQCGFESTTHFGRVFKEILGTTPLKYRKSCQRKK